MAGWWVSRTRPTLQASQGSESCLDWETDAVWPKLLTMSKTLLLVCCLAACARAQETPSALVAAVDMLVAKWEVTADSPGIAILVQQPDGSRS